MPAVSDPAPTTVAHPTPVAAPSPATPRVRHLLPWTLATALLLYLSYFPVAAGWLGWVALTPLLVLVRASARPKHLFLASYLGGLCFFVPVLQWMRVADPRMYFTWLLLATYVSFYFPVGLFLLRALDRRRVPLVVSLPVVWTALELLRAHLLGGFAWYFLGHSQHDFLPIIQISDLTGAYGVTFLVAAVNAVVFEWAWRLFQRPEAMRPTRLVFASACVLALFAAVYGYGCWRVGQTDFAPGPRLALVQHNVPQQIRIDKRDHNPAIADKARQHIANENNILGQLAALVKPDLVVYPETSIAEDWNEVYTDDAALREREPWNKLLQESRDLARHQSDAHECDGHRPAVLLGTNAMEWYPQQRPPLRRFNTALLVGPDRTMSGRYDKIHRVPFGEYVPLRDWIPFMERFAPYDFDYSITAGKKQETLPLGRFHFGVVICYEDTDTTLARAYVNPTEGPKADFLLNTSNDGWFDGTAEHEQHLAICRFRAIEARRAVARSVNMGISAVVDANGRVLAPERRGVGEGPALWEIGATPAALPVERWSEFKKTPGVLLAQIPIDDRGSLYARWGDWLPWACWGVLAVLLLWRRRSEHHHVAHSSSSGHRQR